jgi:hypothetical protein
MEHERNSEGGTGPPTTPAAPDRGFALELVWVIMVALWFAARDWEAPRRLLWPSLALVAVLLLLALFMAWLDRWRKRQAADRLTTNEQLAHFRELFERGEMSREEYARVHALLSDRLRKELDVPPPPEPLPLDPPAPPLPPDAAGPPDDKPPPQTG